MLLTGPAALKEEGIRISYRWMRKTPKKRYRLELVDFLTAEKNLRCPVGDDGLRRSVEKALSGVFRRGKSIHLRSAQSFPRH
jgi:hypothetical protein